MADQELRDLMQEYISQERPHHHLLNQIEERMEQIDDPEQKDRAAQQFAEKIHNNGNEEHSHHLMRKLGGTLVSGAMQAVVAHLVGKKLDAKGQAPSWKDDLIGGLSGGVVTEFGPEMMEKIKSSIF